MKELKTDMQKIFEYENEKELYTTMREMQKTVFARGQIHVQNRTGACHFQSFTQRYHF